MSDDPTPDPDEGKDDPKTDDGMTTDAGKKALDAERNARRDAEAKSKDLETRLAAIEDQDKTETQRLTDKLTETETRAAKAESRALRLEVAQDKGLNPAQAKRLVGDTKEDLEADADEILEAFPAGATPPPEKGPRPDLRGGTDPTGEEVDVREVVDSIPRGL